MVFLQAVHGATHHCPPESGTTVGVRFRQRPETVFKAVFWGYSDFDTSGRGGDVDLQYGRSLATIHFSFYVYVCGTNCYYQTFHCECRNAELVHINAAGIAVVDVEAFVQCYDEIQEDGHLDTENFDEFLEAENWEVLHEDSKPYRGHLECISITNCTNTELITHQQQLIRRLSEVSMEIQRRIHCQDEQALRRASENLTQFCTELASVETELADARDENRKMDQLIEVAMFRMERTIKAVAPYMEEVAEFALSIPDMQPSDDPISVPVCVLRFTHHTVNAEMAFGEDHENKQESIFKLFDGLFRGHIMPESLELDVFLHVGPDGVRGLYSRNNRRTIALHCFQALRRDHAVRVPCRLYRDDDARPCPVSPKSLKQWFNQGYDGAGSFEGCNGLGRSIFPRPGSSKHRGYELFKPAACARRALERACKRAQPDQHTDTVNAMMLVLASTRIRALRGNEETLTLSSAVTNRDQPASLQRQRGRGNAEGTGTGRKGRGKARSVGKRRRLHQPASLQRQRGSGNAEGTGKGRKGSGKARSAGKRRRLHQPASLQRQTGSGNAEGTGKGRKGRGKARSAGKRRRLD